MKKFYKVSYRESAFSNSTKPDIQVFGKKEHALNFYNRLVNCPAYKSVKLSMEVHLTHSDVSAIMKS